MLWNYEGQASENSLICLRWAEAKITLNAVSISCMTFENTASITKDLHKFHYQFYIM